MKIEIRSLPETEPKAQFEVTQLDFDASLLAFDRLARTIGPVFAKLGDAKRTGGVKLSDLLETGIKSVSHADLVHFAEVFGKTTRYSIDGGETWPYLHKAARTVLFAGDLPLFFAWLAMAVEVNFAGFFDALGTVPSGGVPGASTLPPSPV